MAVQNAASRTIFVAPAPTTVMTGNVTQIVLDLVELRRGSDPAAAKARMAKMLPAVLAFVAGAVAGGLGYAFIGFAALAMPIAASSIPVD